MPLVLAGERLDLPGVRTVSFLDDPSRAPPVTDRSQRTRRMRAIVIHAHSGTASGAVKPGRRDTDDAATALALYQTRTSRQVSWDFTIGRDALVMQQNDPAAWFTWHATAWNSISVGIELIQDADGAFYAEQLSACVALVDCLTRVFRIQRQIAWRSGSPHLALIYRADEQGPSKGADMVGVFAHVHNTTNRGKGDPGPAPFIALAAAGYERHDFTTGADLATWRTRQVQLGCKPDGIALDATCDALAATSQSPHGLWVARPGD